MFITHILFDRMTTGDIIVGKRATKKRSSSEVDEESVVPAKQSTVVDDILAHSGSHHDSLSALPDESDTSSSIVGVPP